MRKRTAIGLLVVTFLMGGMITYLASQVVIMQRPLSSLGLSAGVGYGTRVPVVTDDGRPPTDGELFVVRNAGTAEPILSMYSALAGDWLEVITSDNTTSQTLDGDIVLGTNDVDDITLNGPVTVNVIRESFDRVSAQAFEEDLTAAVVTDAGENFLHLYESQLGVIAYRLEAPGGPGLAATPAPFGVDGVLTLDGYTDDADNEGLMLVFGHTGPDHLGASFDEDRDNSVYCEADIDLVDISDTDDVWFGWVITGAYVDPPASDTFNTSALFVISDNAGDLDIETELNAGGTLNDDTGTTWADNANHVLRVTLSADTVSFTLNGTAVTQTNAVLNLDATDRAVCVFGYTNAAAGDPTVTIDYVEIGLSQ